jgi:hypothetical protein
MRGARLVARLRRRRWLAVLAVVAALVLLWLWAVGILFSREEESLARRLFEAWALPAGGP